MRSTGWAWLLALLACTAPDGGASGTVAPPTEGVAELLALDDLLRGPVTTEALSAVAREAREGSTLWPTALFLRAEAHRAAGQFAAATALHARLARWAAGDPLDDGLGGSLLANVALWRWARALEAQADEVDSDELADAVEAFRRLEGSRFFERLARFGFLDALPQLRADLLRSLAVSAWRAGEVQVAEELFVAFLQLGAEADPPVDDLLERLLQRGAVSPGQIRELQARRLEKLGQLEEALPLWQRLLEQSEGSRLDRARLAVARLRGRLFASDRRQTAALLTPVIEGARDPDVVQEALLARASTWAREGSGQNLDAFRSDLRQIVQRFPDGQRADDALFREASHYQRRYAFRGSTEDLQRALDAFARLRSLSGPNDWRDSAHLQPALIHFARGSRDPRALDTGLELLKELGEKSPLRRHATFWRARIHETKGENERARELFTALVQERPYDFFGVRARIHLSRGAGARATLWPDSPTRAALRGEHDRSSRPSSEATSTYHQRIRLLTESDLYARWVNDRTELRRQFPSRRVQTLDLEELDEHGRLTRLALFLAARQDALAAVQTARTAAEALTVHAAVGLDAGDLPLATWTALAELPQEARSDPRFLRTAYPVAFEDDFRAAARQEAVPPELLYALSRRESLFDPAAVSNFSALGLFQFIPSTFAALDERWRLLSSSGIADRETYLLDSSRSAVLGARWLSDELIRRQNCVLIRERGRSCGPTTRSDPDLALVLDGRWFDDRAPAEQQRVVLLALMEHSRGYGAVRQWLETWNRQGQGKDLEYLIETAGAAETRILVRGVLTDASIAASIGLFDQTAALD